jgi:hypothetical protein
VTALSYLLAGLALAALFPGPPGFALLLLILWAKDGEGWRR